MKLNCSWWHFIFIEHLGETKIAETINFPGSKRVITDHFREWYCYRCKRKFRLDFLTGETK